MFKNLGYRMTQPEMMECHDMTLHGIKLLQSDNSDTHELVAKGARLKHYCDMYIAECVVAKTPQ